MLLFLPISTCAFAESSSTNSINLVHKNNTGLVISCIVEHLSDQPGWLSNVLVHNCTWNNFEEVSIQLACHSSCQQGLSSAWWPKKKATLWRRDPHPHEKLRIEQGQLDHLPQLPDLLTQPTDLGICDVPWVLVGHVVDQGVDLSRQVAHDGQGGHVQGNPGARLQLGLV